MDKSRFSSLTDMERGQIIMKTLMKKMLPLMAAILLAFPVCASAEAEYWICPGCGRSGNTGNFCGDCGTARPEPEEGFNDALTQIPGETDRVSVDILRVDGSGYITAKSDRYLYAPWNATDEKKETCWQFSVKNIKSKPPWLWLVIEGQTVDGIWIRNGFQAADSKGKSQYTAYSRAKDIRVEFYYREDGAESETKEFTLSDENSEGWEKIDTGRRRNVDAVVVYICSVYKGKSKPNNACLSEIMLVQNNSAENAKSAEDY